MSSYLELCVKFRKMVGISGSGPAAVTGQSGMSELITIWVADADELIQRKWENWKFLFEPQEELTITASTSTFTLATLSITDLARWVKTSFVRDPGTDDYQKLSYDMTYEEYITSEMYLGAAVTGQIERVFIRSSDNALIFYPTYGSNTTVWAAYYKAVTRIAADDSTTPIPVRFEDVILYRAEMYYAKHLEDWSLYDAAEIEFDEAMERLEANQLAGREGHAVSEEDHYLDVVVE
jgi:hypothetical protein